jgi:hypothetical protein
MYTGLHVKYPLFLSKFNQIRVLLTCFKNAPNIKFHKNSCSENRVVPRGRTDRETDMMELTVVFRNFADAPNRRGTPMPPAEFEPAVPAIKWLQTEDVERTATGISGKLIYWKIYKECVKKSNGWW